MNWRWPGDKPLYAPMMARLLTHICITQATFTNARGGCGAEAGGFWNSGSATVGIFTHTRSGRGRICHFLRTMMVWSARFWSRRGKLGVGPISCGAVFAPAPPPLRHRACVNACNDLCWSQFSARLRPRMCERTFSLNEFRTLILKHSFAVYMLHVNKRISIISIINIIIFLNTVISTAKTLCPLVVPYGIRQVGHHWFSNDLTAPSHCLYKCWLIINQVLCHSPEGNFMS